MAVHYSRVPSPLPIWSLRIIFTLMTCSLLAPGASWAISSRTLIAPVGQAAGEQFGFSVGTLGDFNGDGYDDVIVGEPAHDFPGPITDAGAALLYFGGPGADEVRDVFFGGNVANDRLGTSVGAAGDFNGDGYDDAVIGAYGSDVGGAEAGQAFIALGPTGSSQVTITGAAGDQLGVSVGTAGDVNGDGFADVIVGANQTGPGGSTVGVARIYFGGSTPNSVADVTLVGGAAGDFFGSSVGTAGDVNGDGYADVIVAAHGNDAGGLDAGRAYVCFGGPTMDTVADVVLTGAAAGDRFGVSVGTAGDVNGDGFSDVIVGADLNDAGGLSAGRAYVYYGGAAMDAVADLILTGAAASDQFGNSVATAGDVNGDGYADFMVGAYLNDAVYTNGGRAYLYFGGPGPDNVADILFTGAAGGDGMGISVASAGNFDGDPYTDVIVGAFTNDTAGADAGRAYVTSIYPYQVVSPNGGEEWVAGQPAVVRWRGHDIADVSVSFDAGGTFTTVARGVGSDEVNEFEVIVPLVPTEGALVRVSYTGQAVVTRTNSDASDAIFRIVSPKKAPAAASRLRLTMTGAAMADNLGAAVGTAGDVNGDGYSDLIVGARFNDTAGLNAGQAYVYFGGSGADNVADLTFTGAVAGDLFGSSVGTAGDVNRDGYADLIVGAPNNDAAGSNSGQAYVYFGGPGADNVADVTLTGAAAGDAFGRSVGTAGDLNGDGYADVIVGADGNDAGGAASGQATVYFGGPAMDAVADLTLTGATSNVFLGTSVGTAGDVNGDGYADVVVSSRQGAKVYYGGGAPDNVADLTLIGAAPGDVLDTAVGAAGDVNGDGYADVIAGARTADGPGGQDVGRAYVYHGGPAADGLPDWTLAGEGHAFDNFGNGVGTAGDVNADGYADVVVAALCQQTASFAGRVYVYYGGPGADAVADLTLKAEASGDRFGEGAVGTAGDMNGDGVPELIIGAHDNNAGGTVAGRAYIYEFNRYFLVTPNGGETWNVGAMKTISWLGAEPADVWLSDDGGNTHELVETGVGGSETNVLQLRVPHTPTKFARIKLTPTDPTAGGFDRSDSLFTIQTSVALLSLLAAPLPNGGASVSWSTDPGPDDLAGYRLERSALGSSAWTTVSGLTRETTVVDPMGGPGSRYRLFAVNGFGDELWLGESSIRPLAALSAWPLPYRGGRLTISFATAGGLGGGRGPADIGIYDVSGRLVRHVTAGEYGAGYQVTAWDGRDTHGRKVASGIYFLRSSSGGETRTLRLSVLR